MKCLHHFIFPDHFSVEKVFKDFGLEFPDLLEEGDSENKENETVPTHNSTVKPV